MNTKEYILNLYKVQIKNWVLENFGEAEMEDPSWSIDALAEELADHAHTIYDAMEDGWQYEDIQYIAKEYLGGELAKDHAMRAVQFYKEMDEYQEINRDAIEYAIKQTEKK